MAQHHIEATDFGKFPISILYKFENIIIMICYRTNPNIIGMNELNPQWIRNLMRLIGYWHTIEYYWTVYN